MVNVSRWKYLDTLTIVIFCYWGPMNWGPTNWGPTNYNAMYESRCRNRGNETNDENIDGIQKVNTCEESV